MTTKVRKPYTRPQLTVYGDVRKLTREQSQGASAKDGANNKLKSF